MVFWNTPAMTFDFSLLASLVIIFGAAIVRGFTGFGFSLLTITALSFLYPLQDILPPIFMMELAASLNMLPVIWKDIHWRSLWPLIAGATIGTPIGVWVLGNVPDEPLMLALSIFVLVSVALLWRGFKMKTMPTLPSTLAAGLASGLANGAFGIGGPPVILFYFASPAGAAAGRASLIAFFLAIDILGLSFLSGMENLVTTQSLIRAAIYLPALLAGIWVGHRAFKGVQEEKFNRAVQVLLALMAVLIGVKAIVSM
jgi:uncharacterized membrane protein YfcA